MHATLADAIADVTYNALEADAAHVSLAIVEGGGRVSFSVHDDGRGLPVTEENRLFDPFFTDPVKHPGRRVGLGLPFLSQMCGVVGGAVSIAPVSPKGTSLEVSLPTAHVDLPPMGDLPTALLTLFAAAAERGCVLSFSHRCGSAGYSFVGPQDSSAAALVRVKEDILLRERELEVA